MAFSSDHWVAEHGSYCIEIEVYLAGFFAAGASLFINNERVDNVPGFKSSFSRFTLRHNIIDEDRTLQVKVEIVQKLIVTKAELQINDQVVSLRKTR